MRIPVIVDGPYVDWVELLLIEAPSEEQALIDAATECIDAIDDIQLRLDPRGVQGGGTPNKTLEIQRLRDGEWVRESVWTVPTWDSQYHFAITGQQ